MRTVPIGDHSVSYERVGSGWYRYTVRHTATNRKILDGKCKVELAGGGSDHPTAIRQATVLRVDKAVRQHARGALVALDVRAVSNSEAFRRGHLDQVVGEENLPHGLPPVQAEQLRTQGKWTIPASAPQGIICQAYDVALRATGDAMQARKAAIIAGRTVLIGCRDEQIVLVAERKARLEGDSDAGVRMVKL